MKRFYIADLAIGERETFIEGDEFHHLYTVLRLRKGAEILLFNGDGLEFRGSISEIEKNRAAVTIISVNQSPKESPVDIILIQGMLKGGKLDFVIQKSTEIGVSGIRIFYGDRSISRPDRGKEETRLLRWNKIATGAAKQSGRSRVPLLSLFDSLSNAVELDTGCLKIMAWERQRYTDIREVSKKMLEAGNIALLIGPEGGLSGNELDIAVEKRFLPVTLGPRILRSETAAISALSILQYEFGDMRG